MFFRISDQREGSTCVVPHSVRDKTVLETLMLPMAHHSENPEKNILVNFGATKRLRQFS